jgi:hypothetical protein
VSTIRRIATRLKAVSFSRRLLALGVFTFVFSLAMRPFPEFALLFFMLAAAASVWLLLGAFQSVNSYEALGTKASSRGKRIVAWVLLTPLVFLAAAATGQGIGLSLKPYSQQELAEQKVEELEQQAQALKLEAEQRLAADKATEELRQKEEQEARDKAAAEAKAKSEAAAEAKSELEQAQVDELNARAFELEKIKVSSPLTFAYETCVLGGFIYEGYVTIADDGSSLFVTTLSGDDVYGIVSFTCLAENLEMSAPLLSSIESTNSLAGTKTWNENGLDYQWSYHPSTGLNVSILREQSCFLWVCN